MTPRRPAERVALIGYGAIAVDLARRLRAAGVAPLAVLVRPGRDAAARAALGPIDVCESTAALIDHRPTLVVECAGQAALTEHGPMILAAGCDLLAASTGALTDDALTQALRAAAEAGGTQLLLPAGAIAGIDGLAAMRLAGLDRVRYRSIKPPAAWRGTHAETLCDLDAITAPTVLYAGSARAAAQLFPKNANVAATIALAGAGFEATMVEVFADPAAPGNLHEIEAEGPSGSLSLRLVGRPMPDNPKTSALTSLSLARAVLNRRAAIAI